MSTFESSRKMKPMEQMCFDMGYQKGLDDAVKHGSWIRGKRYIQCSVCNYDYARLYPDNYCSNCGAKMDLEDKHGSE